MFDTCNVSQFNMVPLSVVIVVLLHAMCCIAFKTVQLTNAAGTIFCRLCMLMSA